MPSIDPTWCTTYTLRRFQLAPKTST